MIPTIETICEDLKAGTITVQQAIGWLYMHAEGATSELRDHFAANALTLGGEFFHILGNGCNTPKTVSEAAYQIADAMLKAREPQHGGDK